MSSSNTTVPDTTSAASAAVSTTPTSAAQTTPTTQPPTITSNPPTSEPTTPPTTSIPPTTTALPPTTTAVPPPTTTATQQTSITPTEAGPSTITTIVTSTNSAATSSGTSIPTTATSSGAASTPTASTDNAGLSNSGKIAIAVVVPIVSVALLVILGLWFWRKRKARKDAEEQRRKEVEEYGFNPNADGPTVPNVGGGAYEMREDAASSGYRGWGSTTLAGSTGRKASTTISGGAAPYSDPAGSPTRGGVGAMSERSGEPLMSNYHDGHGDGSVSPEGEILGAMGPSASANRGVDVRRGPSNASSSYSAAARSDGSGEAGIGMAYGGEQQYYNNNNGGGYGNHSPYADTYGSGVAPMPAGGRGEGFNGGSSSPVIRDNPARRNTRIESTGHYPQQQAGISQNF